jgi:hypothetical protein
MKSLIAKLLKSRITRTTLLVALVASAVASIAWSNHPNIRIKQGGAWVGQLGGIQWTAIHAPLSDDGMRIAERLQWITLNEDFEQLLGAFGA